MDSDGRYYQAVKLAELNGVATSYLDWDGNQVEVPMATLMKTLSALGLPVTVSSTAQALEDEITHSEDKPWLQTLPPTLVVRKDDWHEFWIHVNDGQQIKAWYQLEDGTTGELPQLDRPVPPREVGGVLRGRATFQIPGTLPLGYHRVFAQVDNSSEVSSPLIVVPGAIPTTVPGAPKRMWGITAQSYSITARNSWGVGDAADLADLVAIAAGKGAQFLLVNPLHAGQNKTPMESSPYRPVSRQWHNLNYIRPEDIPEYGALPDGWRDHVETLRKTADSKEFQFLDRDATWDAKRMALKLIFRLKRSLRRQAAFEAFSFDGGQALEDYATWAALTDSENADDNAQSPPDKNSPEVTKFVEENQETIEFYKWCQWVAQEQLEAPNRLAHELGMKIGLMADLAVGVHPEGADVWSQPHLYAKKAHVGAPPDMYSPKGQTWAQPPYNPTKLAQAGYEPYIRAIRTALSISSALRVDHVMGLFRLWWIPEGGSPAEGTYVSYDHEALVGILLLEAERSGAILIGEDLGTVEPWVRDYLAARGVLGTSVLWFEKDEDGWPLHPDQYRKQVLATVNTHDLPPSAGYLAGIHTDLRAKLGLLTDPVDVVRRQDKLEKQRMKDRLADHGLSTDEEELVTSLQRYVGRTSAQLVAVSLADVVGESRPQNMPGTSDEYPNWRIPLGNRVGDRIYLEELAQREDYDPLFQAISDEMS